MEDGTKKGFKMIQNPVDPRLGFRSWKTSIADTGFQSTSDYLVVPFKRNHRVFLFIVFNLTEIFDKNAYERNGQLACRE